MDEIDRKILAQMQKDSTISIADLAKAVGLSSTPCWRRVRQLERDGVIRKQVAILDPKKINLNTIVFVGIRMTRHNAEWSARFQQIVSDCVEVIEFYRLAGQIDYLLKVVVPDIDAFDQFYQRLIEQIELQDVTSMFAMEEIKTTQQLPLKYA